MKKMFDGFEKSFVFKQQGNIDSDVLEVATTASTSYNF